jgi:cystathionine beta-lyase
LIQLGCDYTINVVHLIMKAMPGDHYFRHVDISESIALAGWQRHFTGIGGLFSVVFDTRYTEEQTDRFVDSLKLFKIGFSWGGAASLCVPYRIQHMRKNWTDKGQLIRFNVGLEDPQDSIADIEQALRTL